MEELDKPVMTRYAYGMEGGQISRMTSEELEALERIADLFGEVAVAFDRATRTVCGATRRILAAVDERETADV